MMKKNKKEKRVNVEVDIKKYQRTELSDIVIIMTKCDGYGGRK